ncbi:NUDIX domain-containing protein [Parafrankia discariae]|uniref:NUDIX domain-containing protein n=1 Tax=Parafrankia discariae TaxID=365528 RepID=UPI0003A0C795|nr:NUDIX hydrolase [Parafrankia discariae]
MITMTTLRDITLSLGATAVAAFAADELSGGRLVRSLRRPTGSTVPCTRHGWLYSVDSLGSLGGEQIRIRALRPATATEATASVHSAAVGHGGWFALDSDGTTIYDVDDPAVLARAGRSWTERVDVVYVTTPGAGHRLHALARTLTEQARTAITTRRHTTTDYAARLRTTARGPILRDALASNTATEADVRLTADVVALAQRDGVWHVLLIRRAHAPYAGMWALPGGHVEVGERISAAAVRELAEETGVHLTEIDLDYLGIYDTPGRDPRGDYITSAHLAVLGYTPPPTHGDDAAAAQWTPAAQALSEGLAFDHEQILRDALTQADAKRDDSDPWEEFVDSNPVSGVDALLDEADALVQGELADDTEPHDTAAAADTTAL